MSFLCLRLKMQMDMDHECGNLPLGIAEITRFETACVKMYVYNLTRRLKISAENTEDALKWPQHPTELKEKRRYNELSSFEKVQRVVRYLGIYQGIKLISRATFNSLLMSLQPGRAINTRKEYSFIFSSLLSSEQCSGKAHAVACSTRVVDVAILIPSPLAGGD